MGLLGKEESIVMKEAHRIARRFLAVRKTPTGVLHITEKGIPWVGIEGELLCERQGYRDPGKEVIREEKKDAQHMKQSS